MRESTINGTTGGRRLADVEDQDQDKDPREEWRRGELGACLLGRGSRVQGKNSCQGEREKGTTKMLSPRRVHRGIHAMESIPTRRGGTVTPRQPATNRGRPIEPQRASPETEKRARRPASSRQPPTCITSRPPRLGQPATRTTRPSQALFFVSHQANRCTMWTDGDPASRGS